MLNLKDLLANIVLTNDTDDNPLFTANDAFGKPIIHMGLSNDGSEIVIWEEDGDEDLKSIPCTGRDDGYIVDADADWIKATTVFYSMLGEILVRDAKETIEVIEIDEDETDESKTVYFVAYPEKSSFRMIGPLTKSSADQEVRDYNASIMSGVWVGDHISIDESACAQIVPYHVDFDVQPNMVLTVTAMLDEGIEDSAMIVQGEAAKTEDDDFHAIIVFCDQVADFILR